MVWTDFLNLKHIKRLFIFLILLFLFYISFQVVFYKLHQIKFDREINNILNDELNYLSDNLIEKNGSKFKIKKYNKLLVSDGYTKFNNKVIDFNGKIVKILPSTKYNKITSNNEIISFWENYKIAKYDWNLSLIWENKIRVHHDIFIEDDTILVPILENHFYNGRIVGFDCIVTLSNSNGNIIDKWCIYDNLEDIKKYHNENYLDYYPSFYNFLKYSIPWFQNIFIGVEEPHYVKLNSIQVLPNNSLSNYDKRFEKGNWLISLRNVNLILILDKNTKKVVWSSKPLDLSGQHSPSILDNGNMLIFDNGRYKFDKSNSRNYSRIIEIDPISYKLVWNYTAEKPKSFYTPYFGYASRLPNNNTLITDSKSNRIFEILPNGTIVFEIIADEEIKFYSNVIDKAIYRSERIPREKIEIN